MKTFFYMGRNAKNKGGVSWKILKIECRGNRVMTQWGRAFIRRHKAVPGGKLQTKTRRFGNEAAGREFERKRIQSKLAKGYERAPHKKT